MRCQSSNNDGGGGRNSGTKRSEVSGQVAAVQSAGPQDREIGGNVCFIRVGLVPFTRLWPVSQSHRHHWTG